MKTKYFNILSLLAIAVVITASSCNMNCTEGSGKQASETRKVESFNSLDISGGFKINLVQDSSQSVTITADDNLLKHIKTGVNGNRLRIYTKKNICNAGPMVVNIGIRNLEAIKASGAVEVTGNGKINVENLSMKFSGASSVNLDINAKNVVTVASGATEIRLKGQAASHKVDLRGTGKLLAFDFVAGDYRIETSGASECEINVLNDLSVETRGASEIKYKGSPANVSNKKSGASSIVKVQ